MRRYWMLVLLLAPLGLTTAVAGIASNPLWAAQGKDDPKKKDDPRKKEKVYEVGKGLKIDSELTDKDAKDDKREQRHAKVFLVKLVKGKTYQIDMASGALDSYLRVEDAGKKQLAEDDDSGGNQDARITFTAPEDGVYRIITTSYEADETGAFNLRVEEK